MLVKRVSTAIGVIMLPILFSMTGAQDDSLAVEEQESQDVRTVVTQARVPSSVSSVFGLASANRSPDKKISEAAKALRQAKTSDDQAAAKETLTELLAEDYDSRLDEYATYLDNLEKQLTEMRDKLAKRREAKEKMIELRIKVLEAEADDLGWPSRMKRRFGSGFPAVLETRDGVTRFNRPAQPVRPAKPELPAEIPADER